jgi:tetratricopeptide (TPR) repeat protein
MEAERLRLAGKLDTAQTICSKLISHYPDYVAALHTLGLIYSDRGQHQEAVEYLARAAMYAPSNWNILTALGGAYLSVGATEMAEFTLERAKAINPTEATIYATLGELHREQQDYEMAVHAFQRACELDPRLSAARSGLGLTLIHLGKLSEAAKALEMSISKGPPNLNALFALTSLPGNLVDLDFIATAIGALRPSSIPKQDAKIAFIRAAALNQRQSHAEAWPEFINANKIMFRETEASWKRQQKHDLDFLKRIKSSPVVPPPESNIQREDPMVLFFLGPPRSGKTTAELLVSTIAGVKRGFESLIVEKSVRHSFQGAALPPHEQLTELPSGLENAFRTQFLDQLSHSSKGCHVFTITHPARLLDAKRLATILPSAKFVMVKRDVEDMTVRIFMKMFSIGHPYAYSLQSIKEYISWYYSVMDALTEKLPGRNCHISYEDLIAEPKKVRDELAKFCGLTQTNVPIPVLGNDCGCAKLYPQT